MARNENSGTPSNQAGNILMSDTIDQFCNFILPYSVAYWNAVRSSKIFTFSETQNIDGPNICPVDDTVTKFAIIGSENFFPDDGRR
jgi:hypothetical protein